MKIIKILIKLLFQRKSKEFKRKDGTSIQFTKKRKYLNKKFTIFSAIFIGFCTTVTLFYIMVQEIFLGNGNGIHVLYLNQYGEMIPEFIMLSFFLVLMVFGLKYSYIEWSVAR